MKGRGQSILIIFPYSLLAANLLKLPAPLCCAASYSSALPFAST